MTHDLKKYLQPEEIARIERLEIRARRIVEGFVTGLHRSPYFGQSLEFVQHREYVPGDDIRRLDWKVWSRSDRYVVKQYEEDTNVRVWLLVDGSESMAFGSGAMTKFDYARTVAAALSHLVLRQNDAVGACVFDQTVRSRVPVSGRRSQLGLILKALNDETAHGTTDLLSVLKSGAENLSHRSIVIAMSDLFADREDLFKGLQLLRKRNHDVMVLHIMDDQELDFDYSGTTRFDGLEASGKLTCDPRALKAGYLEAVGRFLDTVRRRCARSVIDYRLIRTSENLDAALAHLLNHRVGIRNVPRN